MSYHDFLLKSHSVTAAAVATQVAAPKKRRLLPAATLEPATSFYINRLPLVSSLPPETKRWIRNASDERAAVEYGCRFVEARGAYTVNWIENNCVLYEGSAAGTLIRIEDWQYEFFMQGWGWLWFSREWAERLGPEYGWIRRFRKISGWVPKKNAKSPTLAAAGLYTLIADGEMGQKCFSVALDQQQAQLSHRHAEEFVNQSPALRQHCQVYRDTHEIIDHRTKSRFLVKSGSKQGHMNANEGLNGSLFVDETHVVSEEQMEILKRAGISRRQFILVQLSTAGQNILGYGHKEYEAGRNNLAAAEKGAEFNYRSMHFEYSIDQETPIETLRDGTKIEGLIRKANPSVGRIVPYEVLWQDWYEAKSSDTRLIKWAMYTLNLWNQAAGTTLVAPSEWDACGEDFSLKDVSKFPCVIGGDFAKRRDMCCLCLGFAKPTLKLLPVDPFDPDSEWRQQQINVPHIHPHFFLPRAAVDRYSRIIDLETWEKKKLLTVVEGATIRPQVIANFIHQMDLRYDLRKVGSDAFYSTDVAAILKTEYGWDVDTEHSRYALISQTAASMGPAVEQLQNCILNKEIVHRNHEIMKWQLGNIVIVEDTNGNRRLERPPGDSPRKIDGWAALANTIFVLMTDPELYPGHVFSIKV